MAHQIVQNYQTLWNNVNVLHTFSKVESFVFYGHFAFSSIQTVHVFIMVYIVSASQYPREICIITKGTDRCFKWYQTCMGLFIGYWEKRPCYVLSKRPSYNVLTKYVLWKLMLMHITWWSKSRTCKLQVRSQYLSTRKHQSKLNSQQYSCLNIQCTFSEHPGEGMLAGQLCTMCEQK